MKFEIQEQLVNKIVATLMKQPAEQSYAVLREIETGLKKIEEPAEAPASIQ